MKRVRRFHIQPEMPDSVEKNDCTKPTTKKKASGHPGESPRWTSSAKTAVGTAASGMSRVWFTIGGGVLNEIYYPDIDKAGTRTVRFIVTDGEEYISDEQMDAEHHTEAYAPGVPLYTVTITCRQGRYRLTKQFVTESDRDTLLTHVTFEVLSGPPLRLFLYVEPHLADRGNGNDAWVGCYKGKQMLLAGHDSSFLACLCTVPWKAATAGYVGKNDAAEQLRKRKELTDVFNFAPDGNVFLCGEIDLEATSDGRFLVAFSLGSGPAEAAQLARAASMADYPSVVRDFIEGWEGNQQDFLEMQSPEGSAHEMYRISLAVLRTHESARFPGAFVASLSLPWGFDRGDKDTGAYHVVWPRDLCEIAMGLVAAGSHEAGRRALFYLACTQEADGGWPQNMWLDGTLHWGAVQLDGIAMPMLLADQLRREGALGTFNVWPMIRKAVEYLLAMGPASEQDRWEELGGYSVFTVSCLVCALLGAADFAEDFGKGDAAEFLRDTADAWNDSFDTLLYARGTALAKKHGVDGYYLRIVPEDAITEPDMGSLRLQLKNHRLLGGRHHAVDVVSPDALALTRFGLRAADDPRMLATVKVIDAELKFDLATGPGWIRGTDDGYGETADGGPFEKHGIGRCWPLLAGERGHYEMILGNKAAAEELLRVMARQTSECGMLPEQVWNAADIPERGLHNGLPSGSAMPLAWAHAEYVKLLRAVHEEKVWVTPPQPVARYQKERRSASYEVWTEHARRTWITPGKNLRMDFRQQTEVQWAVDAASTQTGSSGEPFFGIHSVVLALPSMWTSLTVSYTDKDGKTAKSEFRPRTLP